MVKRMSVIVLASMIFLSGCLPILEREEEMIEVEEENEQVVELSPEVDTPENYYRSVLYDGSYPHGEGRGFGNAVVDNRLDLEQLEVGLTSIASGHFDPDTYFFREGHFINRTEINSWLMRYHEEDNPEGLNPALGEGETLPDQEESRPRYISHILEHNYLVENENGNLELGGIVIGLSLNQMYYFRERYEDGTYSHTYEVPIDEETMIREGQNIADQVVERLRDPNREDGMLSNVPIVIALFQEQTRDSVVPGRFVASAVADPGKSIERWQRINERYYLFPSNEASNEQRVDTDRFLKLREDINGFFDNYVGVVGRGYYQNDQLQELTIDVPIQFYGKTEVIAFSQFIADRITQTFPNDLKLQVYVTSVSQQESVIVRNPNEEPFIHIYR
ncbi:CamS family sex pheromone protein [Desertibacillus haloalkaliphilus]|uniref:CamS family sex pheromone protein n=1 Tax=Desertibacillus haloalkaliphilus TaxID=1328930 RepID=UPI001C281199|nr:CamS family sex pheromone protein [Desertibacillus haloalkaliphilus]MBU8906403.1 CamS family sex pheromone protein [Desertibacillus haloalkaliphilus]